MKIETKRDDMMKVVGGFVLSAMVIVGVLFYGMAAANYGIFDIGELLLVGTASVVAIAAAFLIRDRMKSIKAGLPVDDEMSRKGLEKAGYYSYMATIYIALGIGFVSDDLQITASTATGMVILFSAIVFISLAIYYRNRGV